MPRKQYYDKMKNQPGYFSIRNITIFVVFSYLFMVLLDSRNVFIDYVNNLNADKDLKSNMINKYIRLSQSWGRITWFVYVLIVVVLLQQTFTYNRVDYVLVFMLFFTPVMKKLICENQKPSILKDPKYIRFC